MVVRDDRHRDDLAVGAHARDLLNQSASERGLLLLNPRPEVAKQERRSVLSWRAWAVMTRWVQV